MTQIERYIFGRIMLLSMMTLVVATVMAMTTQVLIYIDVMTSTGQSIVTFLTLAVMLMPKVAIIVMPLALLIGAAQTLGNMNQDSELVVMEAAGASPRMVARPVMMMALFMALLTLFTSHIVQPWSNREVRDIVSSARGDLLSAAIRSGTFKQLDAGVVFSVAEQRRGGELGGLFISDTRDPETEFTYYAERGATVRTDGSELLVMSNGQVHRKDVDSGEVSIVEFQSYVLDLALFPGGGGSASYFPKERSTLYLFNPDPEDYFYQRRYEMFLEEIHTRFTDWLYPILFGLVVMTFLGKAHPSRTEQTHQALLAFLVALAYRGVGFYVTPESGDRPLFAYLAYAVPLTGIAVHGILVLSERRMALPQWWTDGVNETLARLASGRIVPGLRRTAAPGREARG